LEYKFLERALAADPQVQLSALIRIAKREPKFNYLGHNGEQFNPLFRGFNGADKDQTEQYDKPVVVRVPYDENELQGRIPQDPRRDVSLHAIVIDDVESEYFTQDQMLLLKNSSASRGGAAHARWARKRSRPAKYDRTAYWRFTAGICGMNRRPTCRWRRM